MPAQANIEIEIHSPTIFTVTLTGEHDATSKEALSLALTVGRVYRYVLVDLTACTFLETTMIHAFLAAAAGHAERGGALELVIPADANPVRRTLEIANVQMALPFHATRAMGLDDFSLCGRPGAGIARRAARVETPARAKAGVVLLRARVESMTAHTYRERRAA